MKKCTKCGVEKPLSSYHKQKLGKSGLRANCKACSNIYANANWEKYHYKQYGISLAIKQKLLENQGNKCAICKKQLIKKFDICVDHCHKTKIIRGILCRKCNSALGQFGDSIQGLTKAIEYILHNGMKT
jgi:hypothetical protein